MLSLCCLDSFGKAAAEALRHVASIFTGLDSKLLKLRGVSPLLLIDFDTNLNLKKNPLMIKNNKIVDLQIIKALGAVFSTSFFADIDYKGQAHVRL